ncbi:DUF2993 domain-containing protein [Corynebacterium pygosceleis]|uniref:DUF2993 domain-containing protein n=1 Tax=Corynebacterium pygosceleis TaxID=2800406 RepID=A0A9Q4CAN6_9CORY|nr:DUF2993 domain-containing protein [Corynebacterium pygosceleis]MCK7638489.1 DUF2993 domain-containing protein [Corynebacterium pygosceleis]MCK7675469.1 DUF2993 domain-containing protein [Corynebacterium pygosceleis]MCL0121137.1 DUF2993 domain-containing protein [Corynebacterium pygosceleis]MCX7445351.1 DUF2993 domain-containing protein [Corynebacterium pygosceleis]MCX7469153.1 DUF2993 domain-containing protein [Corynebacterium pygosceleis]
MKPSSPRRLLLSAVVVLTAPWIVDTVAAVHAESRISGEIRDGEGMDQNPGVTVGGVPYLAALFTHTVPTVVVEAGDVSVEGIGTANLRAEIRDLRLDGRQVLDGDILGAPASIIARTVRLDGVALGTQIGVTDLDIAHPTDISPSARPATEARLTGTPPGFDRPVTVYVRLRIRGPEMTMVPYRLVGVPADREDEVRSVFTWRLRTEDLPLPTRIDKVFCSGGSIYLESRQRAVVVGETPILPVGSDPDALPGSVHRRG